MLSFSVSNLGHEIQIHCDEGGAKILIDALSKIRPTGGHVHLRTPANGGHALDEKTPFGEGAVGEVIITWVGN